MRHFKARRSVWRSGLVVGLAAAVLLAALPQLRADVTRLTFSGGNISVAGILPGDLELRDPAQLASESLTNGALTAGTGWVRAADFALTGDAATYTHSAGNGTIGQASASAAIPWASAGINGWFSLTYTTSAVTGAPVCAIPSTFALAAQTLTNAAGTYTLVFQAMATTVGNFNIGCTSASAATITFDTLSLKQINGGDLTVQGTLKVGGTVSGVNGPLQLGSYLYSPAYSSAFGTFESNHTTMTPYGTSGTLTGVTADTVSTSTAIVLSAGHGISNGSFVTIAGMVGAFQLSGVGATSATLSRAATATLTGAVVQYIQKSNPEVFWGYNLNSVSKSSEPEFGWKLEANYLATTGYTLMEGYLQYQSGGLLWRPFSAAMNRDLDRIQNVALASGIDGLMVTGGPDATDTNMMRVRNAGGLTKVFIGDWGSLPAGIVQRSVTVLDLNTSTIALAAASDSNVAHLGAGGGSINLYGYQYATNGPLPMYLNQYGGNVGIGTVGALSALSINGGLHVGGDSDAGDNNAIIDGTLKLGANCSSSAAPAVCAAAPAGSVVIAAAGTTVTVNTTAVTASSQVLVYEDSSLGTKLGVTCNTTIVRLYVVTARTASTSFTITTSAAPITNPACLSYMIVN